MRFSRQIEDLANVWMEWVKSDLVARDTNVNCLSRRKAGEKCERLIAKRYKLIQNIDTIISNLNDN